MDGHGIKGRKRVYLDMTKLFKLKQWWQKEMKVGD